MNSTDKYDLIHSVVLSIPHGRVATYGQVASLAGLPGRARLVGTALRHLPDRSSVPWHRVVNAQGRISERGAPDSEFEQRLLLEEEGVEIDPSGKLSLRKYQWEG